MFETVDTLAFISFNINTSEVEKKRILKKYDYKGNISRTMLISIDPNEKSAFLKNTRQVENISEVLRYKDGTIQIATDEIFVKIHPERNIVEILKGLSISYDSVIEVEGLNDTYQVTLLQTNNVFDTINKLMKSSKIIYAEPSFIRLSPKNSTYDLNQIQWALDNPYNPDIDIHAINAWKLTKGDPNIKIAVIDEGVDLNHPDLNANLLPGYDATGGAVSGSNGAPYGNNYHGTACAGIIAALDNNIGITGVAPSSKIIPIRLGYRLNDADVIWQLYDKWIHAAFDYVFNQGIHVVSCSFSINGSPSKTTEDKINRVVTQGRNNKGAIVVFSSGNDYSATISSLARLDKVVSVGSIDFSGHRAGSSNYGSGLKVVAPGVNIYTTDISGTAGRGTGDYFSFGGTSAACPHVAGIAALLLSVNPELTADQVRKAIYSTCTKLPSYNYSYYSGLYDGSWNDETGYGLVNAFAALASVYPAKISGDDFVCDCENQIFTLSDNIAQGDSIIWNSEIGSVISGQGTRCATFEVSQGAGSGYAQTVSADIYYGNEVLSVEKTVHGGVPEFYEFVYDESDVQAWGNVLIEADYMGATNYTWILEEGNCDIFQFGGTDDKKDIRIYDSSDIRIKVTASNRCGEWDEWLYLTPTERGYNLRSSKIPQAVSIYTLSYELVYAAHNLIAPFDIQSVNLKPGFYIIEMSTENGIIREKIGIR